MRLLLVEDEKQLCESLAFQLREEDFTVDTCLNGEDGLYYMMQDAYDLVLLDRMLPGIDGVTILNQVRAKGINTPVILLTALGSLQDKITGLDAGADDYIVKPFAFEELMARIRSINRRPRDLNITDDLSNGDLVFLIHESTLKGPTGTCTLSKKEGSLLEVFLKNQNQTLPRLTLLTKVWGPDAEVEDGNLDNYIHFLRRRLKTVGSSFTLKTIRGIGYRLEDGHVS